MAKSGKTNITGGGGIGSDELTATKANIEVGKTAVTKDSDDEIGTGTLRNITNDTTIDHASNNVTPVVAGDAAYVSTNTDGVTRVEVRFNGTRGVIESNTLFGVEQSKVATAAGITAAKLLAGQSALGISGTATNDATATDPYVKSGLTYYSKGVKRTGTMVISSVVSFSVAAYSTSQVLCTWKNPAKGPYSGVVICAKTGGYPANKDDNRKYTGVGTSSALNATSTTIISGLTAGTTYYFRIWVYCTVSSGNMFSGYLQATATPTAHGRQAFIVSGTFTVPANVRSINIHCTGAGGGGGAVFSDRTNGGGGGGGGFTSYKTGISVSPGNIITCVVGKGSKGNGEKSEATLNGTVLVTANGGGSARNASSGVERWNFGGNGGSGGGYGGYRETESGSDRWSGQGGTDGGAGYIGTQSYSGNHTGGGQNLSYAGSGQGVTTREFGSASGSLYSGGGGGGTAGGDGGGAPGGAGGGGTGSGGSSLYATEGLAGSGGGGGGGSRIDSYHSTNASGGSGNVIITW